MSLVRRVLAPLLALAAACSPDRGTAPSSAKPVPVTISASLTAEQQALVKGLSVEVTGPGITAPIVANLDVTAPTVNGTVSIPAGSNRLITVHGFDASAIETYRGSVTIAVRAGSNVIVPVMRSRGASRSP